MMTIIFYYSGILFLLINICFYFTIDKDIQTNRVFYNFLFKKIKAFKEKNGKKILSAGIVEVKDELHRRGLLMQIVANLFVVWTFIGILYADKILFVSVIICWITSSFLCFLFSKSRGLQHVTIIIVNTIINGLLINIINNYFNFYLL